MKRKDFLKRTLQSLPLILIPRAAKADKSGGLQETDPCELSPVETRGPFPIKSPAEMVKSNIISDRIGIPLQINLRVFSQQTDCKPLPEVFVDIWHCDSQGYYSEYGAVRMQSKDMRNEHFLRGRQQTDERGEVTFISIYPGWYPGRAPHIHVEVLDANDRSLRVTQIAFPDEISETVYQTEAYAGSADTTNTRDGIFRNSLEGNMGTVNGNLTDGFIINYDIVV